MLQHCYEGLIFASRASLNCVLVPGMERKSQARAAARPLEQRRKNWIGILISWRLKIRRALSRASHSGRIRSHSDVQVRELGERLAVLGAQTLDECGVVQFRLAIGFVYVAERVQALQDGLAARGRQLLPARKQASGGRRPCCSGVICSHTRWRSRRFLLLLGESADSRPGDAGESAPAAQAGDSGSAGCFAKIVPAGPEAYPGGARWLSAAGCSQFPAPGRFAAFPPGRMAFWP